MNVRSVNQQPRRAPEKRRRGRPLVDDKRRIILDAALQTVRRPRLPRHRRARGRRGGGRRHGHALSLLRAQGSARQRGLSRRRSVAACSTGRRARRRRAARPAARLRRRRGAGDSTAPRSAGSPSCGAGSARSRAPSPTRSASSRCRTTSSTSMPKSRARRAVGARAAVDHRQAPARPRRAARRSTSLIALLWGAFVGLVKASRLGYLDARRPPPRAGRRRLLADDRAASAVPAAPAVLAASAAPARPRAAPPDLTHERMTMLPTTTPAAAPSRTSLHTLDSLAARSSDELDALYRSATVSSTMHAADGRSSDACSPCAGCPACSPRRCAGGPRRVVRVGGQDVRGRERHARRRPQPRVRAARARPPEPVPVRDPVRRRRRSTASRR